MQTVLVLNAISHQHIVISISNLGHTYTHTNHFMASILHVNLSYAAPPVKTWRIFLQQSFTVCTPVLMETSTFGLRRRH